LKIMPALKDSKNRGKIVHDGRREHGATAFRGVGRVRAIDTPGALYTPPWLTNAVAIYVLAFNALRSRSG
jgi:hypothetical protein